MSAASDVPRSETHAEVGALTAGDEYGRDAEVEAPASADYQAAYTWTPIEVDVISATGANHVARAVLAAGYTRRPADWCHNGHPFKPGTTIDNDPPSDDWCDVCGEARRPASGGVPVEALRALADEWEADFGRGIVGSLADAAEQLRALLPTATTDGGKRPCACGAPDTTSLNPAEVVVHRADDPCYIAAAQQGAGVTPPADPEDGAR